MQFGDTVITQKNLFVALFIIGLPILWFAGESRRFLVGALASIADALILSVRSAPIATFFWLVGSSAVLILGHAALMEPDVASEYGSLETV